VRQGTSGAHRQRTRLQSRIAISNCVAGVDTIPKLGMDQLFSLAHCMWMHLDVPWCSSARCSAFASIMHPKGLSDALLVAKPLSASVMEVSLLVFKYMYS